MKARGECAYCGTEMDADLLNKDDRCPDCLETQNIDEDLVICPYCNGSGEGLHEGTVCWHCHGHGA